MQDRHHGLGVDLRSLDLDKVDITQLVAGNQCTVQHVVVVAIARECAVLSTHSDIDWTGRQIKYRATHPCHTVFQQAFTTGGCTDIQPVFHRLGVTARTFHRIDRHAAAGASRDIDTTELTSIGRIGLNPQTLVETVSTNQTFSDQVFLGATPDIGHFPLPVTAEATERVEVSAQAGCNTGAVAHAVSAAVIEHRETLPPGDLGSSGTRGQHGCSQLRWNKRVVDRNGRLQPRNTRAATIEAARVLRLERMSFEAGINAAFAVIDFCEYLGTVTEWISDINREHLALGRDGDITLDIAVVAIESGRERNQCPAAIDHAAVARGVAGTAGKEAATFADTGAGIRAASHSCRREPTEVLGTDVTVGAADPTLFGVLQRYESMTTVTQFAAPHQRCARVLVVIFVPAAAVREVSFEAFEVLLRDDVDYTGNCVGTVNGGCATSHDFDAIDVGGWQEVPVNCCFGGSTTRHTTAVDQYDRAIGREISQVGTVETGRGDAGKGGLCAGFTKGRSKLRQCYCQIGDVVETLIGKRFRGEPQYRDGCFGWITCNAGAGNDELINCGSFLGHDCDCGGAKCCTGG